LSDPQALHRFDVRHENASRVRGPTTRRDGWHRGGGAISFAFAAPNEDALSGRRADLSAKGMEVSAFVDHGGCKPIYFKDPIACSANSAA